MTLNEKDLKEIEGRVEKATPGPWTPDEMSPDWLVALEAPESEWDVEHGEFGSVLSKSPPLAVEFGYETPDDNREFIKHSRQDIPVLLAEVRRLKGNLETAELALGGAAQASAGIVGELKCKDRIIARLRLALNKWVDLLERFAGNEKLIPGFVKEALAYNGDET